MLVYATPKVLPPSSIKYGLLEIDEATDKIIAYSVNDNISKLDIIHASYYLTPYLWGIPIEDYRTSDKLIFFTEETHPEYFI